MEVTTIGIDIAKRIFQLHGVNKNGKTVLRKKLMRDQVLIFNYHFNLSCFFVASYSTSKELSFESQLSFKDCNLLLYSKKSPKTY